MPKPEASSWEEVGAGQNSSAPPLRSKAYAPPKKPTPAAPLERSPWERPRENFTDSMQARQDEKRAANPPILLNEDPAPTRMRRDY